MPYSRLFRSLLFITVISGLSLAVCAQVQNRTDLRSKIESLRASIQAKEQIFLAPSAEDLSSFAEFLRQPGTGMARLMPREKYDGLLLLRGGGAYYSFTKQNNEYGSGSDIGLEQGTLSVGFAGADFGLLTSLGNVAIEGITEESGGVGYLAGFSAPSAESDAREQQLRAGSGFEVDGFTYRRNLPALLSSTYALRSIIYSVSDVLVVFKVTRQDTDGSLVFVWKILKRFPVPQLTPAVYPNLKLRGQL
jgi:hypothetical protein